MADPEIARVVDGISPGIGFPSVQWRGTELFLVGCAQNSACVHSETKKTAFLDLGPPKLEISGNGYGGHPAHNRLASFYTKIMQIC